MTRVNKAVNNVNRSVKEGPPPRLTFPEAVDSGITWHRNYVLKSGGLRHLTSLAGSPPALDLCVCVKNTGYINIEGLISV